MPSPYRALSLCATLAVPRRAPGADILFAIRLKQADSCDELTPTQLEPFGSLCQERRCKAGDIVFVDNAACDGL
jgi:hypothetical protein